VTKLFLIKCSYEINLANGDSLVKWYRFGLQSEKCGFDPPRFDVLLFFFPFDLGFLHKFSASSLNIILRAGTGSVATAKIKIT